MNSKLLALAVGALLTACSATAAVDNSFSLTAKLPAEYDGATAFLVNFDTGEKMDSVTVKNSQAVFKGKIANPAIARVIVEGNRMGNVIVEPGKITLDNRVATGTKLNDMNIAINKKAEAFSTRYQAIPQDSTGDAQRKLIEQQYQAFNDSVYNANINNPIGYSLFLDKAYGMTLPELKKVLAAHPSLKGYKRVQKLLEGAVNKEATSPGHKFVDFAVTNDSVTQRLSDYVGKGKPVLVDFWASWCGPCIRETKVIKEILNEYGPKGLEVLGVAVWDEVPNTLNAIKKHELPWPQIINAQTIPTDLYGIPAIPCIILFAPDGTILSRDKQDADLKADVKAYFDGTLTPESVTSAK